MLLAVLVLGLCPEPLHPRWLHARAAHPLGAQAQLAMVAIAPHVQLPGSCTMGGAPVPWGGTEMALELYSGWAWATVLRWLYTGRWGPGMPGHIRGSLHMPAHIRGSLHMPGHRQAMPRTITVADQGTDKQCLAQSQWLIRDTWMETVGYTRRWCHMGHAQQVVAPWCTHSK